MARQRHQNGWVTDDKGGNYYGHFYRYIVDAATGARKRNHELVVLGSKSEMRKWEAKDKLREIIARELGPAQSATRPDPSTTFEWFVENRFIPMHEGRWRPASKVTTQDLLRRYLIRPFGRMPLQQIDEFQLQTFLNELAKRYGHAIVQKSHSRLKAIFRQARKMKFIMEDPAEDLRMPYTRPLERLTISWEQITLLMNNIDNIRDKCLLGIGVFCALRASEVFGLTWRSYEGDHLTILDTAWQGKLYPNQLKTKSSRAAVHLPEEIRSLIEQWRNLCSDTSPEALMFPTVGKHGTSRGKMVPFIARSFMQCRIHPIAAKLGIPLRLVTFRVFRRTVATDLQRFGTIKDAQVALRHGSMTTTSDVYMQPIPESVAGALNARTRAVFAHPRQATTAAGKG